MDPISTSTPNDKQITVDVPEDRVAEFHAFFARFLAGRRGRGRGRGYGRPHRGGHRGHHGQCGHREAAREEQATTEPAETTEV